jgi:AcrR family transcriptional regulator
MKAKKRGYHHGDLRRELLDASVAIIREGGVESLSLRDVARRAGVSPAAPYHHFATKTDLLSAIALDGFAELRRVMSDARDAEEGGSPTARLRAIGEAYVRFAIDHPAHFHLMFRPAAPPPHHEGGAPSDAFRMLLDAVREVVAVPEIGARTTHPALVLLSWSIVHGAAALVLDGPLANGNAELGVTAAQIPKLVTAALESLLVEGPPAKPTPGPRGARTARR